MLPNRDEIISVFYRFTSRWDAIKLISLASLIDRFLKYTGIYKSLNIKEYQMTCDVSITIIIQS